MKRLLIGLVAIIAMSSVSVNASEIYIHQAAGKTDLSAEKCAKKAKEVFEKISLTNIKIAINLSNGKKVKHPNENSPRTVRATDKERSYSIQCRLLGSNIVNFTIAGKNSNQMQKIWNNFYNIK